MSAPSALVPHYRKSQKLVRLGRRGNDGLSFEKAAYVIASVFLDPNQHGVVLNRSVVAASIAIVDKHWQHQVC